MKIHFGLLFLPFAIVLVSCETTQTEEVSGALPAEAIAAYSLETCPVTDREQA